MATLGFIGIGNMGVPMATRLINAGHDLVVFDTNAERAASLGAKVVGSPKEVGDAAEIVLFSLPVPAAVRAVIAGADGVMHGSKVKIVVDLSTTGRDTIVEMAQALQTRGITLVDAPVSGGVTGAAKGTLAVMVAGPAAACATVRPLLDVIGKVFIVGDTAGQGQAMKVLNNLLSATAMGIENVLCLTGDGVANGDHPGAKPVFDLDSVSLIAAARTMRDGGTFLSGRALNAPPTYYIGAVENPFAPPAGARVQRLKKKIDAGAQFIMTQMVYDLPSFELFMEEVCRLGLHRRCHILAGVGLLTSPKTARWIAKNVPGVRIPEQTMAQLEAAASPMQTGIAITVDILKRLKAMEGLAGAHLMFHPTRLNLLADILTQAGLDTPESRHRPGVRSEDVVSVA